MGKSWTALTVGSSSPSPSISYCVWAQCQFVKDFLIKTCLSGFFSAIVCTCGSYLMRLLWGVKWTNTPVGMCYKLLHSETNNHKLPTKPRGGPRFSRLGPASNPGPKPRPLQHAPIQCSRFLLCKQWECRTVKHWRESATETYRERFFFLSSPTGIKFW